MLRFLSIGYNFEDRQTCLVLIHYVVVVNGGSVRCWVSRIQGGAGGRGHTLPFIEATASPALPPPAVVMSRQARRRDG